MAFFAISATLAGLGFLPGSPGSPLYVGSLALVFVSANLLLRLTDQKGTQTRTLPRPYGTLFVVLAFVLLSSTFLAWLRGYLNLGLIAGVLMFLLFGTAVRFVPGCLDGEKQVSRSVHAIVIAATVSSAVWLPAMLGAVGKRLVMPFQSAAVGLNEVGGTLGMLVVLVMGLLVSEESSSKRMALGISLLILALGLVLTKSRGAWVGASAGLAYILIRTKRVRTLLFFLATVLLAVSFLEPVKTTFITRLSQTEAGDPSWLGRIFMWKTALQIIPRNFLLGIGLHNFGPVKYGYGFPRFLDPLEASFGFRPGQAIFGHTHNLYIELLMGLGVFGFVSFLLIVVLTIANLDRVAGSVQQTRLKGPALGLAALMIAYMTHSLFDYLLWIPYSFLLFAVLLGISLAVIGSSKVGAATGGLSA